MDTAPGGGVEGSRIVSNRNVRYRRLQCPLNVDFVEELPYSAAIGDGCGL